MTQANFTKNKSTEVHDTTKLLSQETIDNVDKASYLKDILNNTIENLIAAYQETDFRKLSQIFKIIGIFIVVIIAQILIKGVIDTIDLIPFLPGILELIGLFIVGHWSWNNLTTSEKRSSLKEQLQNITFIK